MATAPIQLDEKALVRDALAELELPAGVKFRRVEEMTEWTGEAALRVYLSVSRRTPPTPKYVKELNALTHSIRELAFSMGLEKFLFFKFEVSR